MVPAHFMCPSGMATLQRIPVLCTLQVFVMEDDEQHIRFRNLSIHRANNEEEALNLVRPKWLLGAGQGCAVHQAAAPQHTWQAHVHADTVIDACMLCSLWDEGQDNVGKLFEV